MTLYLVCDMSGSMGEDGRPFLMRTAVTTIAQWISLGYGAAQIKLCAWASEASVLSDWGVQEEYPAALLACQGSENWKPLIHLFGDKPDGKILLLTDGFWSRSDARLFKQWKDCLPADTLRILKVGPDANPQLKGADVFATEEVFAALDGWLEGVPA